MSMDPMFEESESTKVYIIRHRRLLLLIGLFLVISFYVFVVDGRFFSLFKMSFNPDPVAIEQDEIQQSDGQIADEIAMIEFKRRSIPLKYSFSGPTTVNDEDANTPMSVEEWREANSAVIAAQENRAPVTEAIISGETFVDTTSNQEGDEEQGNNGDIGTGSITGSITLAAPVKVGDPFVVGTPNSVTISGIVYAIDKSQSIIALDSENGEYQSLSVEAGRARIVIDGSTFGLQALEDGDIIEVVGTQYSGSHTVTAKKITVTGSLQLVPGPQEVSDGDI